MGRGARAVFDRCGNVLLTFDWNGEAIAGIVSALDESDGMAADMERLTALAFDEADCPLAGRPANALAEGLIRRGFPHLVADIETGRWEQSGIGPVEESYLASWKEAR